MFPGFLLAFREGIEASLIIGIILGVLNKTGMPSLKKTVWSGAIVGVILSLAAAWGLMLVGASFEGKSEQIFEGLTMLLAAGILTWMVFWMRKHSREKTKKVQAEVEAASRKQEGRVLFLLAFTAVVREGIELALFLASVSFIATQSLVLIGALLGILLAVGLAVLLNRSLLKLNLRQVFNVTSILLIIFAAGLVAHGVHELNEAGWIPAIQEQVWNTNPVLHEDSSVGLILKALLGYNGNPSLTEVISYLLYYLIIFITVILRKTPAKKVASGVEPAS